MPAQPLVYALVTFLHDLFTAAWIGGLIAIGITVLPAAQAVLGKGPETNKLMAAIQKRQSVLVYVSIVGLVITGALQANRSPEFAGFLSFGTAYSAALALKHILVLVMVAASLYRSLALGRQKGPLSPSQQKLSAGLLYLNMGLGVAVLLLSGGMAALGTGPALA